MNVASLPRQEAVGIRQEAFLPAQGQVQIFLENDKKIKRRKRKKISSIDRAALACHPVAPWGRTLLLAEEGSRLWGGKAPTLPHCGAARPLLGETARGGRMRRERKRRMRKSRGRGDAERGGMGWDWLGFQAGAGSWLNASGSGWRASGLVASPSAFLPHFGEGSKGITPARGRQQGHGPDPAGTLQCLDRACWCGQDTGPTPQRSPRVPGVVPELLFPKGEVKEGFSGLSKNHLSSPSRVLHVWVISLSFQPGPASQHCAPTGPCSPLGDRWS